MTFGLRAMFCIVTCVAALLGFILTLGERSLLYLIPLSFLSIGFLIGRRIHLPATGAFLSTSILLLYVGTFPFVLNFVNTNNLVTAGNYWLWKAYEWTLINPTFEVGWFWAMYDRWSELCRDHPYLAIIVLVVCFLLGVTVALWADRKFLGTAMRLEVKHRNQS